MDVYSSVIESMGGGGGSLCRFVSLKDEMV